MSRHTKRFANSMAYILSYFTSYILGIERVSPIKFLSVERNNKA